MVEAWFVQAMNIKKKKKKKSSDPSFMVLEIDPGGFAFLFPTHEKTGLIDPGGPFFFSHGGLDGFELVGELRLLRSTLPMLASDLLLLRGPSPKPGP